MGFALTEEEWRLLSGVPITDLVDLAVEVDLCAPAEIDRRALIEDCLPLILDRARAEGLPMSKYDREDLEALPTDLLQAVGRLQGLNGEVTVDRAIRAGRKVYKRYGKLRPKSAVALLLPLLLTALARAEQMGYGR